MRGDQRPASGLGTEAREGGQRGCWKRPAFAALTSRSGLLGTAGRLLTGPATRSEEESRTSSIHGCKTGEREELGNQPGRRSSWAAPCHIGKASACRGAVLRPGGIRPARPDRSYGGSTPPSTLPTGPGAARSSCGRQGGISGGTLHQLPKRGLFIVGNGHPQVRGVLPGRHVYPKVKSCERPPCAGTLAQRWM